jgi:predicted RNase H-like HicB family nuclease
MMRAIMRHAVVIERADSNYSAHIPDLPGCVAAGSTIKEAENEIREAILFHIDGMKEDGLSIPAPVSSVEYIEVAA